MTRLVAGHLQIKSNRYYAVITFKIAAGNSILATDSVPFNEYEMIEAEITIENKSNVIPLFNDYQKLTLQ